MHKQGFLPNFNVQGQIYQRIGSLLHVENEEHEFLQIFFKGDSVAEDKRRCSLTPDTRIDIITDLLKFLHAQNPYIKLFQTALEHMPRHDYKIVIRADKTPIYLNFERQEVDQNFLSLKENPV